MSSAIEIWQIAPHGIEDELAALDRRLDLLPPSDQSRLAVISDPGEARFWHGARTAIRLIVARRAGLALARADIDARDGGRPTLPTESFEISIAHCRPFALLAIAAAPVGIDFERVRPTVLAPSRQAAIETAALAIAAGAPLPASSPERFIAAWCRIEALAKATGLGLARTLSDLGARHRSQVPRERAATAGYVVRDLPVLAPGHAAAIAAPAPLPPLIFERFPEHARDLEAWTTTHVVG